MIILSICIASYNKSAMTRSLAVSILKNKNPKIEVIVCDNASEDGTVENLASVEDSRLKVYQNEYNIGGAANMIKAVCLGSGIFVMYVNDRDVIFAEKLNDFVLFLEKHMYIKGGWCVRDEILGEEYEEFETRDALSKMCFRCEHPTGFFFHRESLGMIPADRLNRYADTSKFVPFPWEYIQAEVSCMGITVKYNRTVWQSTGDATHSKYISSYVKLKDAEDRWFSPDNCLARAKANADFLVFLNNRYGLNMKTEELKRIIVNIYVSQQKIGLWRYKNILSSQSLARHYLVETRKVSVKEMRMINKRFIDECCGCLRKFREDGYGRNMVVREMKRLNKMMMKIRIKEKVKNNFLYKRIYDR